MEGRASCGGEWCVRGKIPGPSYLPPHSMRETRPPVPLLFCRLATGLDGMRIENKGHMSTLTFFNVSEKDYGNYTCVATNKLGITNASITLYGECRRPGHGAWTGGGGVRRGGEIRWPVSIHTAPPSTLDVHATPPPHLVILLACDAVVFTRQPTAPGLP